MQSADIVPTFSWTATSLLCDYMGHDGRLMRNLDVTIRCANGVWIVDVESVDHPDAAPLTLPAGFGMEEISCLADRIAHNLEERGETWYMPSLSKVYRCADGRARTLRSMLEETPAGWAPSDDVDMEALLFEFGCA